MSDKIREIRNHIKEIAGKTPVPLFVAEVITVADTDCIVKVGNVAFPDVHFFCQETEAGNLLIKPQIGSMVMVADLSGGGLRDLHIIKTDKVDVIIFGKGDHTTAFADVLKKELKKFSKRLDDVINALNQASPDSSAGTFSSSLKPLLAKIIDKEDFSGIENDKIKHSA